MAGIHRERPGADAIAAVQRASPRSTSATASGCRRACRTATWSPPTTVESIVNTGMGFEGPLHHRAYAGIGTGAAARDRSSPRATTTTSAASTSSATTAPTSSPRPTSTPGAPTTSGSRRSAPATPHSRGCDAIVAAMQYAESLGVGQAAQARPEPTMTFDDRLELTIGGRRLELLSVPGGETTDSLVVWLPDDRIAFTGNLFGPLFGHVPNLVTIRGDRYRDPLAYVASVDRVLALGAERLLTGHFDPIDGADRIAEELTAMRDSMLWVHDRIVDGMKAGTDVHTLMREIVLPDHFDVGEGYGKTSWNVRAIWETVRGLVPPPLDHRALRGARDARSRPTSWPPPAPTRCVDAAARPPRRRATGRGAPPHRSRPRRRARRSPAARARRGRRDPRPARRVDELLGDRVAAPVDRPTGARRREPRRVRLHRHRRARHRRHQRHRPRHRHDVRRRRRHVTVTGTRPPTRPTTTPTSTGFAYHPLEITDPASIDALVASLDRLDVLVNNAGANFPGGRDEWEPDAFAESRRAQPHRPDATHRRLPRPARGQRRSTAARAWSTSCR